jgi:hypothetical protein
VEQSPNDDSPMYTVRYVVRASTLLPLSGPLNNTHMGSVSGSAGEMDVTPTETIFAT